MIVRITVIGVDCCTWRFVGLNVTVKPVGRFKAVMLMFDLKPFCGVIVKVTVFDSPDPVKDSNV
jgi:hypothetical protein